MAKRKDVTAELGELERRAADAYRHARDARLQVERAKTVLDQLRERQIDAYAAGDEDRAVALASETDGLEPQLTRESAREGLARAADTARTEVARFRTENARELLAAREAGAREITDKLNAAVAETIQLHRSYLAERQEQDRAVAAVPGATPRMDGPPPSHPWERALRDLERSVREHQTLEPPLPRFLGIAHRRREDDVNRPEHLRRKKQRSDHVEVT
jgi:hypothetical protein